MMDNVVCLTVTTGVIIFKYYVYYFYYIYVYKLNFLNITSKFHTIIMAVSTDLLTKFHIQVLTTVQFMHVTVVAHANCL